MAKQKKHKQTVQISPENYIRTRARNLPILQCWVNKDWRRIGTATVMVVRKHVSGNLTLGIYIVDLLCMGVRESMYQYNIPEFQLKLMIKDAVKGGLRFVAISYRLAHNIIYSAIEYAEEYGFHPTTSFTRVTQYVLEPDTDAIPLTRIHCGDENGNPVYMRGDDNEAKTRQALARLHHTAGYGKYQYCSSKDKDKDKDESESEETLKAHAEFDKMKDSYLAMTEEERETQFRAFFDTLNAMDVSSPEKQEIFFPMTILAGVIIKNHAVTEITAEYIKMYRKIFTFKLVSIFDFPNSFFVGLQCHDFNKFARMYKKVVEKINPENFEHTVAKLHKDYGDIPFVSYIELNYDKNGTREKYLEKLDEFSKKFPDYFMFKTMRYAQHTEWNHKLETLLAETHEPLTVIEFLRFLGDYLQSCIIKSEHPLEKFMAFERVMYEYEDEYQVPMQGLFVTTSLVKLELVKQFYGMKDGTKDGIIVDNKTEDNK
jgi:hypothetical protein